MRPEVFSWVVAVSVRPPGTKRAVLHFEVSQHVLSVQRSRTESPDTQNTSATFFFSPCLLGFSKQICQTNTPQRMNAHLEADHITKLEDVGQGITPTMCSANNWFLFIALQNRKG